VASRWGVRPLCNQQKRIKGGPEGKRGTGRTWESGVQTRDQGKSSSWKNLVVVVVVPETVGVNHDDDSLFVG
jgi:hypothetical protein